jgi:hypothetical protein
VPLSNDPLSRALSLVRTTQPTASSARSARSGLLAYLAVLAQIGPANRPDLFPTEADVVSYLVNAHMAWTLALNEEAEYSELSPVALRDIPFPLAGRQATLSSLTTEIISRAPAEPRFVLFLNPGFATGPPLPPWPLEGHSLAWQLSIHARVCGADPSFWQLDEQRQVLRLSPFVSYMPGLPASATARAVRLLELVPPPPELANRIVAVCGGSLQRCTHLPSELQISRWQKPAVPPQAQR